MNESPQKSGDKTGNCIDCGGIVSRRAVTCPHCGSPDPFSAPLNDEPSLPTPEPPSNPKIINITQGKDFRITKPERRRSFGKLKTVCKVASIILFMASVYHLYGWNKNKEGWENSAALHEYFGRTSEAKDSRSRITDDLVWAASYFAFGTVIGAYGFGGGRRQKDGRKESEAAQ